MSVIIGMILFFLLAGPVQHRYYARQIKIAKDRGDGIVPPEARLPAMAVGAFILPASLFIFAFCSYPHVHWIGSAIGATLFGFACECFLKSECAEFRRPGLQRCQLVHCRCIRRWINSKCHGSKDIAVSFVRRLCCECLPFCGSTDHKPMFVDRFYASAIGIEWASGVLAFIALVGLPCAVCRS